MHIQNSDDYKQFVSLFEDFETIDKLAKQRIEENNLSAVLRCMNLMKLVVEELKSYII